MKKQDYGIEKFCVYCEHSQSIIEEGKMLCKEKGVVSCTGTCSSFIYDPLKRIPSRPQVIKPLDYIDIENAPTEKKAETTV